MRELVSSSPTNVLLLEKKLFKLETNFCSCTRGKEKVFRLVVEEDRKTDTYFKGIYAICMSFLRVQQLCELKVSIEKEPKLPCILAKNIGRNEEAFIVRPHL